MRASSKELLDYRKRMEYYWLENSKSLKFARELFTGKPLHVHVDFMFENSRLVSKKGFFKRLDVANRLKALHDCLAAALLMDDCFFIKISAEKWCVPSPEREGANIRIETYEICELN